MTAATARRPFELKGLHVLFMIVGFFVIICGLDGWFAWLAVHSFPGEVSKTAYEDGLKYNQTLEQRDAQAALGWTATVDSSVPGVVRVRFADAAGRPVSGLTLQGSLERPATASGLAHLTFREPSPGLYEASAPVARGGWDLTLKARGDGEREFLAQRRLLWR